MKTCRINNPNDFGRVAVLMGGCAAERDVSLISGQAVLEALLHRGVDAVAVDVVDSAYKALAEQRFDRAFNIIHGRGGEDGVLQGLLQDLKLPYTGSGVLASALSMDKLRTKLCWRGHRLPTPEWCLLDGETALRSCEEKLGFPVIVKPAQEGSSIGMNKAENYHELLVAWEEANAFNCDVYAEAWVHGKEYTVSLLDGEPLPVIGLETPNAFYDYEAKYLLDTTTYHCPCGLEPEQEKALQALAIEAAKIIGVRGWGRVDVFIDAKGQQQLIEINTVPGMTDHSLVPMAAKALGISFDELTWRILETSIA